MSGTFSVALVGRIKHGAIMAGLQRKGWNQTDLAKALECSPTDVTKIVNMHTVPSQRWLTDARIAVLFDLTQQLPDELWPEWYRSDDWLKRDKRITAIAHAPVERLLGAAEIGLLTAPEAPDLTAMRAELRTQVSSQVQTLSKREQEVLAVRFGLNGSGELTLDEAADRFGGTRERIRQIEVRALRKLRRGTRRCALEPFADPPVEAPK